MKIEAVYSPDTAASAPSPRLYPKLLGAAWARLDPVVQRVHTDSASAYAEGTAQVIRAPGRLLGYILDAARVPRSSCASAVRLAVWHRGTLERWHRVFCGRSLVTHQSEAPGNLLAERLGVLEFRFRLLAQDGALLFRQEALALRLGALRVPLPGWISLVVAAREGPAAGAGSEEARTSVDVRVTLPTGALLFAYRGTVRWQLQEAAPTPNRCAARISAPPRGRGPVIGGRPCGPTSSPVRWRGEIAPTGSGGSPPMGSAAP